MNKSSPEDFCPLTNQQPYQREWDNPRAGCRGNSHRVSNFCAQDFAPVETKLSISIVARRLRAVHLIESLGLLPIHKSTVRLIFDFHARAHNLLIIFGYVRSSRSGTNSVGRDGIVLRGTSRQPVGAAPSQLVGPQRALDRAAWS